MRLKSLEVVGFKSFVDRTIIHFEDGVTGIVGPNGCGKSNVVDAIRWVMGEQSAKHLRGSSMEDVIFNGAASRDAMGMAQVFLTFDNSDGIAPAEYADYSEIQVGRRLYRSGESEYYINKTPCRLRDIIDLFLGTGVGTKAYSIVEQGMIGQVVSAKPDDRRAFIEEVAGISKFKSRKEAALRKMESTKVNLERLNDIVSELSRQLNSLNRQAKKAERFQRYSEELKTLELQVVATKYCKDKQELENLLSQNSQLSEIEVSSASELSNFETELDEQRLTLSELEHKFDDVQQKLYATQNKVKLNEASLDHKASQIETIAQQALAAEEELAELQERLMLLAEKIVRAQKEKCAADEKLASSTEAVRDFEDGLSGIKQERGEIELQVETFRDQGFAASSNIAQQKTCLENLSRREIDIQSRIAKNQSAIDAIDNRKVDTEQSLQERSGELVQLKQLKLKTSEGATVINQSLNEQREELGRAEQRLQKLHDSIQEKKSRHDSLLVVQRNLEGYQDGVKAVLQRSKEANSLQGVMGTVAEIVDTEPKYEQALSAVLGEKLQYVVVNSQNVGLEAVEYLKTESTGRGTFVPLSLSTSHAQGVVDSSGDGVIGPLMNYVQFSDDHKKIGSYLLGDVLLVEDLQRALGLWQRADNPATYVTLDGDLVDSSGVVTGGNVANSAELMIAQQRKIDELADSLASLQVDLNAARAEVTANLEQVSVLENNLEAAKREAHNEELRIVTLDRDLEQLRGESERFAAERDRLSVELAALAHELEEIVGERDAAEIKIITNEEDKQSAEQKMEELNQSYESLREVLAGKEQELISLKVALGQAEERQSTVDREIEQLESSQSETTQGIERRTNDINEGKQNTVKLKEEIENLNAELATTVELAQQLETDKNELQYKYEQDAAALKERELSIREIRKRHDEALQASHQTELRATEQQAKVEYLLESVRERYRLDLAEVADQYVRDDEEFDLEAESAVVEELKTKISKIGPVNVDAVKEYDELAERYNFLNQQQLDLNSSLDALGRAITKINRTSKQRFSEAFESVNSQFQELFPKLFRGGKAYLKLTDTNNILESGLEIYASPPGKKLQSISLLSGGEKALTAIALIFSIFLIKPSPFCLLDEVDAPLDDANIDRFNDMIRSMIHRSQFILITHNKRTMEMADTLYGVTMEEAGVSKMVSVKLNVGESEQGSEALPALQSGGEPAVA